MALAAALVLASCGKPGGLLSGDPEDQVGSSACPATRAADAILPGVSAEQRDVAYWVRLAKDADEVVLSPEGVRHHNLAFAAQAKAHPDDEPLTHFDLLSPSDPARLAKELKERLAYMRQRIEAGEYVDAKGEPLPSAERVAFAERAKLPPLSDELRVALSPTALRCGPRDTGIYKGPEVDVRFDRNNCSTLRAQEPVKVLARWPGGMLLVRSAYALGWVAGDAPLSPPIPREHAAAFVHGPKLRVRGALELRGERGRRLAVNDKTLLASHGQGRAVFATPERFDVSQPLTSSEAEPSERPLTRRALLEEAFSYLATPYGWGGQQGGRDCSRFLMDVFGAFGLELPRHSGLQARAGSMTIDITKAKKPGDRLAIIDAAHRRGIVLLHFPGHIMLYLGRNEAGTPMVIHAFAEYLERCEHADEATGQKETLRTVDQVQVSDLSLGKGTSRSSFLERITHVTLLAETPGSELLGVVERRPPAPLSDTPTAPCKLPADVGMLVTPREAHPGAPLRAIVSSTRDLGSVAITFIGPNGQRQQATPAAGLHRIGGPPFGYWAEVPSPVVGPWRIEIGEGDRVEACSTVTVNERGARLRGAGGTVWRPQRAWNPAYENLYSSFVEQLFDHPFDDRTWPNLQVLLKDRERNVLFDYLGQNEEQTLDLQPDCADLPYFLRAYFSWKMRLPFAYRYCNRGKEGKAPYCDRELHHTLEKPESSTEVSAFADFMRIALADGVHSGTGRTAPEDEYTDYYPVPLTREAIRPGVTFADPYGHLFVVADWIDQGVDGYGVLVGADAQPDGTIGRRRFWRGSFLFTPDTSEAGAGFKAFRPVRYRGGEMRPVANADIAATGMTPFSMDQYRGSKDDFYDAVEALINPRPLDPMQQLDVLIEALYEQVKRRVVSVDNAIEFTRSHRQTVDMPSGHAIFETSGAWEDYSTPSRDMRLLIAMDTVVGFPAAVQRNPERFGVPRGEAGQAAVAALTGRLEVELAKHSFAYQKSDGGRQPLSLADVVARAKGFEMAYNPNDCVEIRWAAPEGSAEGAGCRTHAPAGQRERMRSYRSWFAERKRPPR